MPFIVVETDNAQGGKELSVVPEKWTRNTKSGKIIFWSNAKNIAEQEKLLRDENSCPKKSWLKYKCTVRRSPTKSFAEAKRLLEELSGESSSDVTELVRRKRKANNRENNFQKMLVLENTPPATHQTPPQTMNVRDEIFLPVAASSQATPAVVITPNSETNFHQENQKAQYRMHSLEFISPKISP
ncbi:uncharacterized protein LOC129771029 [Toxorhynchites rutilus septentrionalis]|uniref:uncharacterized protein LOC129771029 n=1 Tax=Toxorhynchites rutilus septentrionalis TaxID=329112 RepID=UPI0024785E24|nr:uncharacterized protein LOC129771029 [Toxorhynchites rutilus septentrionalis]